MSKTIDLQYKTMKVGDIHYKLVRDYGCNEKIVDMLKGKTQFVEALQYILKGELYKFEHKSSGKQYVLQCEQTMKNTENKNDILDNPDEDIDVDFDDVEIVKDVINHENENNNKDNQEPPLLGSVEWHDYVMSQFVEDELVKGNPTVDGLRRVAEKVLGPINKFFADVLQTPDLENERRATVRVTVHFTDTCYQGCADAYYGNSIEPYSHHPVSLAETRAEGRALKRALGLKKINAVEELADVTGDLVPQQTEQDSGLINATQLRHLDVMGERLNINIKKMIENEGYSCRSKLLTNDDALKLVEKVSNYQNKSEDILDEIKGYNAEWIN